MFNRSKLDQFHEVNGEKANQRSFVSPPKSLRRSKSATQKMKFAAVNVVFGGLGFIVVVAIAADGVRNMLDVSQMKLSRLPLPLIAELDVYSGFQDLDLAFLISGLLAVVVTAVWTRVITELKGLGTVWVVGSKPTLIAYLYASIAMILILADAFLFFKGLSVRGGGWGEMHFSVPILGVLLYQACVAGFAAYHSDYLHSDIV